MFRRLVTRFTSEDDTGRGTWKRATRLAVRSALKLLLLLALFLPFIPALGQSGDLRFPGPGHSDTLSERTITSEFHLPRTGGESHLLPSPYHIELSGYIGGDSDEVVHGATTLNETEVYLVGRSTSKRSWMPSGPDRGAVAFGCTKGGQADPVVGEDVARTIQCSGINPDNGFIARYDERGQPTGFVFIGGPNEQSAVTDIVINDRGEAFIVGWTTGPLEYAENGYGGGDRDAFVAKIDRSKLNPEQGQPALETTRSATDWLRHLGGQGRETAVAVDINSYGDPVVVGKTDSRDYPTTPTQQEGGIADVPQPVNEASYGNSYRGGSSDAFVTVVDRDDQELLTSFYLGGSRMDGARDLTVRNQSLYIAGETASSEIYSPWGEVAGGSPDSDRDAFVFYQPGITKADTGLIIGNDRNAQVATGVGTVNEDGGGYGIVVSGYSMGTMALDLTLPPSTEEIMPEVESGYRGGESDGFVAYYEDLSGNRVTADRFRYLGGSAADRINDLQVRNDLIYLAGTSTSEDLPTTNDVIPTQMQSHGGQHDAYTARLSGNTEQLHMLGYAGGSANDRGNGLAISPNGITHLVGTTLSGDFYHHRLHGNSRRGPRDGFLTRIRSDENAPADLAVSASGPSEILMDNAPYEVEVTLANMGASDAENVTLEATIQRGQIVSAPGGCSIISSGMTCQTGQIGVSFEQEMTIEIEPSSAPVAVVSSFTASTESREYTPGNNRTTQKTNIISRKDLQVRFIEVTQGIQDRRHSIPLAKDRTTHARVHVKAVRHSLDGEILVEANNVTGVLHGTNAQGNTLPGSPITPLNPTYSASSDTLYRRGRGSTVQFRLPAEWVDDESAITLQAELNPDNTFSDESPRNNNLYESGPHKLWRIAPICVVAQPVLTKNGHPDADMLQPDGTGTVTPGEQIMHMAEALVPATQIRTFVNNNEVRETTVDDDHNAGNPYTPYFEMNQNGDYDGNKIITKLFWRSQGSRGPDWCLNNGAKVHWGGLVLPGDNNVDAGLAPGPDANILGVRVASALHRQFYFNVDTDASGWWDINSPYGGTSLAHELGHNYRFEHVNCGNGDLEGPYLQDYPFDPCRIGPTQDWYVNEFGSRDPVNVFYGFDPRTPSQVTGTSSNPQGRIGISPVESDSSSIDGELADLMSYADDTWTSANVWYRWWRKLRRCPGLGACDLPPRSKVGPALGDTPDSQTTLANLLYDNESQLPPTDPVELSASGGPMQRMSSVPGTNRDTDFDMLITQQAAIPERVIMIHGFLNAETLDIPTFEISEVESALMPDRNIRELMSASPAFTQDLPVEDNAPVITLLSADGEVLSSTPLHLSGLTEPRAQPSLDVFTSLLPWYAEVERARIEYQGEILAETHLANREPGVEIEPVEAQQPINDTFTLRWSLQDPVSADSARYMVHYSPDGGEKWDLLVGHHFRNSLEVDGSRLAGSDGNGLFRVIAFQGGRTGADTTEQSVSVARHAPEIRFTQPDSTASYPVGGQAYLEARAYDAEDGYLSGSRLEWTVTGPEGKTRASGTGENLTVFDLLPGIYTATLRVTDSDGNSAISEIQFPVGDRVLVSQNRTLMEKERKQEGQKKRATESEQPQPTQHQTDDESEETIFLSVLPKGGFSLPGVGTASDIPAETGNVLRGEQSVFSYGGSIAFGSRENLFNGRLTGLYRSSSVVTSLEGDRLITEEVDISFAALTADLIFRPLPDFIFQPYLMAGIGARKVYYPDFDIAGFDESWKPTAQVGVGADLQFGNRGPFIGVELTDYLSNFSDSGSLRHDAFLLGTVGIPLF